MEREIVMTGVGGQGIQLIAKLLAHAGIREGRQVMTFGVFMA
jgi:Pyruvate/2-oxoacid:ferredoxin oxidoreductase gamma subunit